MVYWTFAKGENRSHIWEPYRWILKRLEAEFGQINTQTFDYENGLAVLLAEGRQGIKLRFEYHGKGAYGHYEDGEDEKIWIWDNPDWQLYDILAFDDPKAKVEEIIVKIKQQKGE